MYCWDFKNIKKARIMRGLTQEKLSEISGVSQSLISKLEKNQVQSTNLDTIMDIAIALNCYPLDLINMKREREDDEDIFNLNEKKRADY